MRKMSRWTGSVFAFGLVAIGMLYSAASEAYCYNTSKVMNQFTSQGKPTIVVAHRGLWREADLPENSMAAAYKADQECIEAIELDIKMTSDGVPVLMHDFNLGRTTTIYNFKKNSTDVAYNPVTNSGYNPKVSEVDSATFKQLKLLTANGKESTESAVLFRDFLAQYRDRNMSTVVLLDIKDDAAAKAVAREMLQLKNPASLTISSPLDYIIFKINATVYPKYENFLAAMNSVDSLKGSSFKVMPIYTTNMLQVLKDKNINAADSLATYLAEKVPVEINLKETSGLMYDLVTKAKAAQKPIGIFNAIPDFSGTKNGNTAGNSGISYDKAFYNNDGSCCYQLSTKFATFDGRSDKADRRGENDFLLNYDGANSTFGVITTDYPKQLIEALKSRKIRDVSAYGGPFFQGINMLAANGQAVNDSGYAGMHQCLWSNDDSYGWTWACAFENSSSHSFMDGSYVDGVTVEALSSTNNIADGATDFTISTRKKPTANWQHLGTSDNGEDVNWTSSFTKKWRMSSDKTIHPSDAPSVFLSSISSNTLYHGYIYNKTKLKSRNSGDSWQYWVFSPRN